jgi:hypothetical protein
MKDATISPLNEILWEKKFNKCQNASLPSTTIKEKKEIAW